MSSLRPFNTSTRTPKSTKLKGFTTNKNVTEQLEIDSRRMEERLNELKMTMDREKQERQAQGHGNIWASGKVSGTLTAHGLDHLKKGYLTPQKPSKPSEKCKVRKVKVLKDLPLDIPERPKPSYGLSSGDSMPVRKSFKGPACGQCESKPVSLTCMECVENYCTTCFAKFHLKGALRNHWSVPYQSLSSNSTKASQDNKNNDNALVQQRPENPNKSTNGSSSHPSGGQEKVLVGHGPQDPTSGVGTLLEGEYNEEQSAASFAAALVEWRNGGLKQDRNMGSKRSAASHVSKVTQPRPTVHDMGVGDTSVADTKHQKLVEIKFSDSLLSYADKLLLKKHRRTEIPGLMPSPTSRVLNQIPKTENVKINGFNNDLEMSSDMQEEHERCTSIFSGYRDSHTSKPLLDSHQLPSQLMITEINDELIERDLEVESVYSVEDATALSPTTESRSNKSAPGCTVVQITGEEEILLKEYDQLVLENCLSSNQQMQSEETSKLELFKQSEIVSSLVQESPHTKASSRDSRAKSNQNGRNLGKNSRRRLTKAPSEGLTKLVEMGVKGSERHRYTDCLERFFKAGLSEDETEPAVKTKEKLSLNEMEKCTYQGPGVWRPSSSLSVNEGDQPLTHSPSPPKLTNEGRGSASLRRKQLGTKNKVESNTISWVLSQQPLPSPDSNEVGAIQSHQKWSANSTSGRANVQRSVRRDESPRSASRIEIEGDNFARYDNDNDGQDAADEETLEELTWELASQSGRITAEGRVSSLSIQDVDPYIKNTMFASSLDEELDIIQDNSCGSGLSTPYDDIAMGRLSEEDMRADFGYIETERDKQSVEQLHD